MALTRPKRQLHNLVLNPGDLVRSTSQVGLAPPDERGAVGPQAPTRALSSAMAASSLGLALVPS